MSEASWALQQALHTALTGDSALTALLASSSSVYSQVPQDAAFPYLTIGDLLATEWDSKSAEGQRHTITVHGWSRDRGSKVAAQIIGALHDLLHDQALSVTGHTTVLVRQELAQVLRDPDGLTWHAVVRFEILTETA